MITDSEDRSMIPELEQIIQTEEAKPEAERDADLIDDCIHEIAELKGVKAEYSDEEIDMITDKLVKEEKSRNRKRFIRLAAGIAAAFVIVSGVTACAINPAFINWLAKVVRMPFGSTIEDEFVTYYYEGLSEKYNSVEELLKANDLDVYYPTILPNQIKLTDIEILNENNAETLSFTFTSTDFRYTIQRQYINPKVGGEVVAEIEVDGLHFLVYPESDGYISYAVDSKDTYIIQSNSIDDLILFIGGLRKE